VIGTTITTTTTPLQKAPYHRISIQIEKKERWANWRNGSWLPLEKNMEIWVTTNDLVFWSGYNVPIVFFEINKWGIKQAGSVELSKHVTHYMVYGEAFCIITWQPPNEEDPPVAT
jgi:hypothetical protein